VKWRSHFNATAIHSRHGKTRTDIWLRITAEQLVKAPSVEVCRNWRSPHLKNARSHQNCAYRSGARNTMFDVPGVLVGDKLMITRNPWRSDVARVVIVNDEGFETFHVIHAVRKMNSGFAAPAHR
jgi:hypothetical protein